MAKVILRLTDDISESSATKIQDSLGENWTVTYSSSTYSWDVMHNESKIGFRLQGLNSSTLHPYRAYPIQNGTANTSTYLDVGYTSTDYSKLIFTTTNNGLLITILNANRLGEIVINTNTKSAVIRVYSEQNTSSSRTVSLLKFTNTSLRTDTQYTTASSQLGVLSYDTQVTQLLVGTTETGIYFLNSGFTMMGSVSDDTKTIFIGNLLGIEE